MQKVKMLKLSVEDVYTERMDSMEIHRYSHEHFMAVECDPDYRAIVRPQIRSRVVPINRYFKQDRNGRSENLVCIDMENIEDWLPMFQGEVNVAVDILQSELSRLEKEADRQAEEIHKKKLLIRDAEETIRSYVTMNLWQKVKFLMTHKLF